MTLQEEGVLAIGSGPILLSLVETWYESGLSKLTIFVTDLQSADLARLKKMEKLALRNNPEARLHIRHATGKDEERNWTMIVRPFSFILYVSQPGEPEELRRIQHACVAEGRPMLPAIVIRGTGMAGPLLSPAGGGLWESAWRRIHASVFLGDREPQLDTDTAVALLANVIVQEWRKTVAGEKEPDCENHIYLLEPVTLTGSWHPIFAHPLVSGYEVSRQMEHIERFLEASQEPADSEEWFSAFTRLTSTASGIFHVWGEEELTQLPLAQCRVQPADPLSDRPAPLLPAIVRSGLTHEEARLESGLAGLEAHVARMLPQLFSGLLSDRKEDIGIGIGLTIADSVARGLRACLTREWRKRSYAADGQWTVRTVGCKPIEDVRCRYYLQALTTLEGEPHLAIGEPELGFPVVWVSSGSAWYGSVDLTFTLALRQSLQKALCKSEPVVSFADIRIDRAAQNIAISHFDPSMLATAMKSAVQTLKQQSKRLEVFDIRSESFIGKSPFIACGVLIGEEESP